MHVVYNNESIAMFLLKAILLRYWFGVVGIFVETEKVEKEIYVSTSKDQKIIL